MHRAPSRQPPSGRYDVSVGWPCAGSCVKSRKFGLVGLHLVAADASRPLGIERQDKLRDCAKEKARQGPLKAPSFPCRAVQSLVAQNIDQIVAASTRHSVFLIQNFRDWSSRPQPRAEQPLRADLTAQSPMAQVHKRDAAIEFESRAK